MTGERILNANGSDGIAAVRFPLLLIFGYSIALLLFPVDKTAFAEEGSVSRFDRVAAVVSTHEKDRKLATAFFVRYKESTLMVAAKHSATETNLSTEIWLPSKNPARQFKLAEALNVKGVNPWKVHKSADLAICELDLSKLSESEADQVKSMSVSMENFEHVAPKRSSRIECIGFSLGLGVSEEHISAIVMTCFVASEDLTIEGTWGRESVIFASPAVGAGSSGGLVTLHCENASECRVVGMCTGFNGDDSGAKLARVLPAEVLIEFIESQVD